MMIIIGSGLAGYMLAKEYRKLNTETPLMIVTESEGDFYSKPILSNALTTKKTPAEIVITPVDSMAKQLNAEIFTNTTVESIDPINKTIKFNHKDYAYDHLILACGAIPISLNLLSDAADKIFSVNNLEDYKKFRTWVNNEKKQIAIIGSGLVGCEFANDLINVGCEIDIISLDSYPLARFIPEVIGQRLEEAFAAAGIRWHLGRKVVSIEKTSEGCQIFLENGQPIHADGILSAIGLRAHTELAQKAGLKIGRGIIVDRMLRTSDPNIYALGDCAEVAGQLKQYIAPLLQCARALAKTLAGEAEAVHYPSMPIVIKTPACPVVTSPVPAGIEGTWYYEGEGKHSRALFFDTENQLRGFALIGDKVRDKLELAKQLPLVFES